MGKKGLGKEVESYFTREMRTMNYTEEETQVKQVLEMHTYNPSNHKTPAGL